MWCSVLFQLAGVVGETIQFIRGPESLGQVASVLSLLQPAAADFEFQVSPQLNLLNPDLRPDWDFGVLIKRLSSAERSAELRQTSG